MSFVFVCKIVKYRGYSDYRFHRVPRKEISLYLRHALVKPFCIGIFTRLNKSLVDIKKSSTSSVNISFNLPSKSDTDVIYQPASTDRVHGLLSCGHRVVPFPSRWQANHLQAFQSGMTVLLPMCPRVTHFGCTKNR